MERIKAKFSIDINKKVHIVETEDEQLKELCKENAEFSNLPIDDVSFTKYETGLYLGIFDKIKDTYYLVNSSQINQEDITLNKFFVQAMGCILKENGGKFSFNEKTLEIIDNKFYVSYKKDDKNKKITLVLNEG